MNITEVANLKKQLEEEFRKNTEAIDRVMTLLESVKANEMLNANGSQSAQLVEKPKKRAQKPAARRKPFGRERDAGMGGVAKKAIPYLRDLFTRKDLISAIKTNFPDWANRTTKDAMNGAVKRLLEDNFMSIEIPGAGKRPAMYRKVGKL